MRQRHVSAYIEVGRLPLGEIVFLTAEAAIADWELRDITSNKGDEMDDQAAILRALGIRALR